MPEYRVYLRNADYELVDELTDWLSLTLVKRFNAVGSWELEIAASSVSAQHITPTSGIVVRRDGAAIFSGSVTSELARTARTIRAAGADDMVLLEEPARPTPSQASGPYPDDYDVRTGVASTVMRAYVDANIGPSAPAACKISALTLAADPTLGTTVTGRANFQSLLALLAELAITPAAGGLRFDLVQGTSTALVFSISASADRSDEVMFSTDIGTAQDYADVQQLPQANYWVVLGGDGFGANRTVVEDGDAGLIAAAGRRITGVYDARGITDTGELNQKLAELLAGAVASRKTTVQPFDVPSLEFGTDWDFGDLVTVVVDGEVTEAIIREVEIQLTNDRGAIVTPMIGDAGSSNDDLSAVQAKAIRDRVSNLERNWNVPDESIIRAMLTDVLKPPIGQVVAFAGATLPDGWLWCDGSAVSRTTYSALYAALGGASSPWGQGNGSTTFNVPNVEDRVILGAGNLYALAATGGAASANLAHTHDGGTLAYAHTHSTPNHAHPHTHATPDHAHPHTHTGPSHNHAGPAHTHSTDINHDHNAFTSGFQAGATVITGAVAPSAGTWDHQHTIDVPALGTTNVTSSSSGTGDTGLGGTGATGSALDSASSGSGSSGSALDTAASGSGTTGAAASTSWSGASGSGLSTQSLLPPYVAMPAIIYAGV